MQLHDLHRDNESDDHRDHCHEQAIHKIDRLEVLDELGAARHTSPDQEQDQTEFLEGLEYLALHMK